MAAVDDCEDFTMTQSFIDGPSLSGSSSSSTGGIR